MLKFILIQAGLACQFLLIVCQFLLFCVWQFPLMNIQALVMEHPMAVSISDRDP